MEVMADSRNTLGEKQNEFLPAKLPGLHCLPIAVEPLVPADRRPRIWLAPLIGDGFVSRQLVPVIGIHRPAELCAGGFVQGVEELPHR